MGKRNLFSTEPSLDLSLFCFSLSFTGSTLEKIKEVRETG
jgi:hypothetical protein